jgi:ribosomal protein RSM22 (predicted rRNA methylase)
MRRKSLYPKKESNAVFHDEDLAQFGDLYFPEEKETSKEQEDINTNNKQEILYDRLCKNRDR